MPKRRRQRRRVSRQRGRGLRRYRPPQRGKGIGGVALALTSLLPLLMGR